MEYFSRTVGGRRIVVRDAEPDDVEPIVDYWYMTDESVLRVMGIDPSRLPPREVRRTFFNEMIGNSLLEDSSFLLMLDSDSKRIAYYLINGIEHQVHCQQHFHILEPAARNQKIASNLALDLMALIFELGNFKTIISEPAARNRVIHSVLSRNYFRPIRRYFKPAQGICGAMEVLRYEISPGDLRARTRRTSAASLQVEGCANE